MALAFQQLFPPAVLPNAVGVIYTLAAVPASNVLMNGRVRLSNTTAGPVTATLYCAAAAAPSGAGNICLPTISIAANSYIDVDIPVMAAGDTLRGVAGAAASITIQELGGVIYS